MPRGFMRERRPGVFELRAYVAQDAATGKKRYLHATFRGPRERAEEVLADFVAQADAEAGRLAGLVRWSKGAPSVTVADACESWFSWALHHLEPGSVVTSRDNIDRYINPRIGAIELWRLRRPGGHRRETGCSGIEN